METHAFVDVMLPAAQHVAELSRDDTGRVRISARLAVAWAAVESGWGAGPLFGGWTNPWSVKYPVGPYERRMLDKNDYFAVYPSLVAAASDLFAFLNPANNPRYATAWTIVGDDAAFIQAVQDAGYCGDDPAYAGKIMRAHALLDGLVAEPVPPSAAPSVPTAPPAPAPVPANYPGWPIEQQQRAVEAVRQLGLIKEPHDPDKLVSWAELSVVILRVMDRMGDAQANALLKTLEAR